LPVVPSFSPFIRSSLASRFAPAWLTPMQTNPAGAAPLPLPRRLARYLWREWIRPMTLPLLVVAAAKSSFADINIVPTGSMKPTILEGDVVFVNKLAYDLRVPFTFARIARWSDPARGDIVVCFSPDDGQRLVKRVVGLPGDTIELRHNLLFVNGARQPYSPLGPTADGVRDMEPAERASATFAREHFATRPHSVMALPAIPAVRDFGPVTVPAGSYLMMGDNRDNSRDSRYFGFVPRREIVGEATAVFVSADPAHWLRPRFNRFFSKLD
jgi:signal peptidase I